jgi:hypothetical protein
LAARDCSRALFSAAAGRRTLRTTTLQNARLLIQTSSTLVPTFCDSIKSSAVHYVRAKKSTQTSGWPRNFLFKCLINILAHSLLSLSLSLGVCVFRRLRNKCVILVGQTELEWYIYGSQKFFTLNYHAAEIHSGEIKFRAFCWRSGASLSEGSFFIASSHPPCPFLLRPAGLAAIGRECRRLWNYMRGIIWEVPPALGRPVDLIPTARASEMKCVTWRCGPVAKAFHRPQLWLAKSLNAP